MPTNPTLRKKPTLRLKAPNGETLTFFVRDDMLVSVDGAGNENVMLVPQPVLSVFGRLGAVVAVSGDYSAILVSNDSGVSGATVKAALDWLLANKCPLDINGKVPVINLPEAILGAVNYQGTWDAGANDPELDDGTGEKGWYYVVDFAGTQDLGSGDIVFSVGDWVIHNGLFWERLDGSDAVTSVAGKTGNVTLEPDDIVGLDTALLRLPQPIPMIAEEAINGHTLVHVKANGKAVKADPVAGLVAHAFTPIAISALASFDGYPIGTFYGFTGLTPGADYYLGANGVPTLTVPASPSIILQFIGVAVSADTMNISVSRAMDLG